jgi:hypothetical protein
MANPHPGLQGFADPEKEGWREEALARVMGRGKKTKRNTERKNGMFLFFDDGFRVLLDEAARRRNISMTGYLRRAAAAMIAFDLGINITEALKHTAYPAGYGELGGGAQKHPHDTGEGRGNWTIRGLD